MRSLFRRVRDALARVVAFPLFYAAIATTIGSWRPSRVLAIFKR